MNADNVLFSAVKDLTEIFREEFDELVVDRIGGPDRQALKLLRAPLLLLQPAFDERFRGTYKVVPVPPL